MSEKFIPPTPKEATEYAASIGYKLDGAYFCDTYQARGWMYGKTPLRDWRAAVRVWKHRETHIQNPSAAKDDDLRRRQLIEKKQLAEYVGRIRAIRSWRGNPKCPFGDPAEAERRMLYKIRDNYGVDFCKKILAQCNQNKPGASCSAHPNKLNIAR